jgi:hypothetical protein
MFGSSLHPVVCKKTRVIFLLFVFACFYHVLVLHADILPLAIARDKIFGTKGQPMVKSIYIQAPMNYFFSLKHVVTSNLDHGEVHKIM